MTGGSLQIHPAALEEAEAAIDWYSRRSRRAAEHESRCHRSVLRALLAERGADVV
ncbi:MAG: hypothetical protein ACLQVN_11080 [Bryobacteraceae bacterium]